MRKVSADVALKGKMIRMLHEGRWNVVEGDHISREIRKTLYERLVISRVVFRL